MTGFDFLETETVLAPIEAQIKRVDRNRRFAGFAEAVSKDQIAGWVLNLTAPSDQVLVSILLGGVLIGQGVTCHDRSDVKASLNDLSLKRRNMKPGFEIALTQDAVLYAMAELAKTHKSKDLISYEVVLLSGETKFVVPSEQKPRRFSEWLTLFEITPDMFEAAPTASRLVVPQYQGTYCACMEDISVALPEEDLEAVLDSPFFDAKFYAHAATEADLWFAEAFSDRDELVTAAHFAVVGATRGISPVDNLSFDARFYECVYEAVPGLAPILQFIQSWAKDAPQLPNAAVAGQLPLLEMLAEEYERSQNQEDVLRLWAVGNHFLEPAQIEAEAEFLYELDRTLRIEELAAQDLNSILSHNRPELSPEEVPAVAAVIRDSDAFDEDYYLTMYPDIAQANVDPLMHYVRHGEREGRRPSPHFDPEFYLGVNGDVRVSAPAAFAHYLQFGRHEGRLGQQVQHEGVRATFGKPILFVGHSAMLAGAERVLLELVKWVHEHTRREITVYLMHGGPFVSEFCRYANVITAPDDSYMDRAIRLKLARQEWEYVYLNTVVAGNFLSGIDAPTRSRLRVVGHIHEMEQVLEEHRPALDLLLSGVDFLISASPASSETLIEKYEVPPEKIETIAAFITPVSEKQAAAEGNRIKARDLLGLGATEHVVMGCGSLYWRKGPDIFLEVAARVLQETHTPTKFVWVGDGPDRADLEAQAQTMGIKDHVIFTGSRTDSSLLLAAADLFFLSSREDPFPLVCLEAAQHRVPTLFLRGTTGIHNFVEPAGEDTGGYGADSLDPDEIAAVMASALSENDDRLARGLAAQARLYESYVSKKQCRRIYHVLRNILGIAPLVSVIVPNYNHADYLPERLSSILDQSHQDFELIVLDDCSTDDSHAVIRDAIAGTDGAVFAPNETNSGAVFRQWQKGLKMAKAPYIWMAESDDRCDPEFLSTLLDCMEDPGVVIATGDTVPFTVHGMDPKPMRTYLNSQCPGLFDAPFTLDGDTFANIGMGSACLLVNASGLLMDAESLRAHVSKGLDYSMCGDWAIYLNMLRHGRVAYRPQAKNYFRRHATSRVHEVEGTALYFEERGRIAELVYDIYPVNTSLHGRIRSTLQHEVDRFQHVSPGITLADVAPARTPSFERRKRIAFYVHGMTFSHGGIERLAGQLANHLVSVGYDVHILCRHWGTHTSVYPLHAGVKLAQVFSEDWMESSIDAVHGYLVEHGIDIFVPMLSERLFEPLIEAGRRAGVPVIASEHNDPWKIEELWWSKAERAETFAKAARIHLLSEVFIKSLPAELQDRAVAIPNGVDNDRYQPGPEKRPRKIVSAGRLVPQKRMDLLISGFAQSGLAEKGWELDIYGAGQDFLMLEAQIKTLGMARSVRLAGTTSQMARIMSEASLVAVTSDFEGFGIVVVEAMATATPVVAFDDCNGPNEIIMDGVNGRLVSVETGQDRAAALSLVLQEMAADEASLRSMGEAGITRARDFSLSNFLKNWEECLSEM